MDTENSGEVLDVSEAPQQEESVMEKEVVSNLEAPEESTEPEKPPAAADEETEQLAVNGHEVTNSKETAEPIVTLSDEKKDMETGDSLPKEKSETESVHVEVAPPGPDESSEKSPVIALDTEPENIQPEQQPVPEKSPEPLQVPLAEPAPVPEPDDLLESEAELPDQTLPEPAVPQQPPEPEEKTPEQVGSEAEVKPAMEAAAATAAAAVDDVTEEKKTAETDVPSVTLKEDTKEDETKEAEKPAESDAVKEAEPAAGDVKSEQDDAAGPEEDPAPVSGSLCFALLEQEQTKEALLTSRTLVVLRGLPGSGKSFLARAIADTYKDHCSVVCADSHGVKPENPDASADGYKALDEAVVACCSGGGPTSSVLVVVDDTNHTQDRLARLGEIGAEHHLVVIFLEPRTEWSRDLAELHKKNKRGLEVAQMEVMKGQLEGGNLPLFFGWFLLSSIQDKIRCTSMDFLKTLDTLEAFKKHSVDFTGKAEKEVDLEQYFKAKGKLHCTTKYCDYGKAEGAKEYAENPAVKECYGCAFELSLSALFVTPRTVGARVSLTEGQISLWPADVEKEAAASAATASLPPGSRAHVTLGCAEGVEAVQTGLDLLEILALQQEGQQGEPVEEMELGTLTYYGEGRWLLSLREPICVPAIFSSSYERTETDSTKKEPEKKKKQKCTIL